MRAMTSPQNQNVNTQKGERGFEFDAHVTFAAPLSPAQAQELLRGFGLRAELYGQGAVSGARLTGKADLERARLEVLSLMQSGRVRRVEAGLRGFLRLGDDTDWMPWRRNVIVPPEGWARLPFEEGLRYVLE